MNPFIFRRLGLFLALLALTACPLPAPADPGVTDTEIVIGAYGPLTGHDAPWGAMVRGMDMYFRLINEQGGINGRRVRLEVVDSASDPMSAVVGLEKLLTRREGGVFALLGGADALTALAVLDLKALEGVPWVGMASGHPDFSQPPRPRVFPVYPAYPAEAALLTDYAVAARKARRVGVVYTDDSFGQSGLAGVEAGLKKYGRSPVVKIPVERRSADLSLAAEALAKNQADAVVMWLTPRQAVALRRAAAQLQFEPLWLTGAFLSDAQTMNKLTGRLWAGTVFTCFVEPPDDPSPLMRSYRRAFKRLGLKGEIWGPFFYGGIALAEPLVEGLRRCGPWVNRERFVEQMETIKNFKGIAGPITYTPDRRRGVGRVYAAEALRDGRIRPLTDWLPLYGTGP